MTKAVRAPPKNISSVARKAHMPSVAASFCCAESSNWCARFGFAACKRYLDFVILIRRTGNDRDLVKILRRRRAGRLPFQAGGFPGIGPGRLAVPERPEQITQRNDVADS